MLLVNIFVKVVTQYPVVSEVAQDLGWIIQ
jgi:hypothetical protein